jgi:HEAT repeat protein
LSDDQFEIVAPEKTQRAVVTHDSLRAALTSADPRARERAANGLIAVPDPRAEEPLLEALDDPEAGVRGQAALAIGSLKSQRLFRGCSS